MVIIKICPEPEICRAVLGFTPGENQTVMLANENGRITGHTLFCQTGEQAELLALETDDTSIHLLLVQGALNVLEQRGAKQVQTSLSKLEPLLLRLGFQKENGVYTAELEGYFQPGKHCSHN